MYCKHCGAPNSATAKFCKSCGKTITPAATISEHFSEVKKVKRKINRKVWWISGGAVVLIILVVLFFHYRHAGSPATAQGTSSNNSQSVVNVLCDNGKGGSGTIFSANGTILTNNHVIAGATVCQVTIPDSSSGQPAEIYDAAPVITPTLSKEYDIATLQIDGSYTDASGTTWGAYPTTFTPFTLPSTCSTSTASQLGDSVRIYGYPSITGGYNLTITDGVISSFEDDGDILTSAKIDSGNSGGLAIDQNGCWLGIPSAIISDENQNFGVIIPGSIVQQDFLSGVPAKYEPIAVSTSTDTDTNAENALSPTTPLAPEETNDQVCQDSYGTYSEWSGKTGSNGQPSCVCDNGYAWDGSGNECATETSLQQGCVDQFGSGSYSYLQSGKSVCGCSSGYEWNSNQTACVVQPSCGTFSNYNSDTGECQCDSGYSTANGSATGYDCESDIIYCQNLDGSGATYDSNTNSCGCSEGYTDSGGQCESDYTYCTDREGYGASYDAGTNQCTCDSGYVYSGGQCVYSSY